MREHIERAFADPEAFMMTGFGQQGLRISLHGDIAWAVFDGWANFASGERDSTCQTRVLERDGETWRPS